MGDGDGHALALPRFVEGEAFDFEKLYDVTYELTKNLTLQFDAINLTKEKYESFVGDESRPRDIRYTPTTYGLALRFKL